MNLPIQRACLIAVVFLLLATGGALAEEFRVGMKNWEFGPKELAINTGDTVIWVNDDDSHHTVTFDDASMKSSENIKAEGGQYSMRFDGQGEFTYYCKYHRDYEMKGRIIVRGKDK